MVLQGRERRAHSGRETKRVRWGNASGENTGPAQKTRGFQGRERGLLPPLCRLWGRKRGRQGTEAASSPWRREPSSGGAPRPRQKWRLFVLTEVREGGRTRRRGERVPGAADESASGRETDGSTAEQCQGAGGDRGARACGARACGTRRPPASPPESLAFLNI